MGGYTQENSGYFRVYERLSNLFGNAKETSSSKNRLHKTNYAHLKNVINYFSHLRNSGRLSDKEFSAYITFFMAAYAEKEITGMVNEALVKPFKKIFEEKGNDRRR